MAAEEGGEVGGSLLSDQEVTAGGRAVYVVVWEAVSRVMDIENVRQLVLNFQRELEQITQLNEINANTLHAHGEMIKELLLQVDTFKSKTRCAQSRNTYLWKKKPNVQ